MKKSASILLLILLGSNAVAETNPRCTDRYFNKLAGLVGRAETKCERAQDKITAIEERRDEALRKIDLRISEFIVTGNPNSFGCKIKGIFNNRCDARKRERILHLRRESLVKKYDLQIQRAQEKANRTCEKIQEAQTNLDRAVAACATTTPPSTTTGTGAGEGSGDGTGAGATE